VTERRVDPTESSEPRGVDDSGRAGLDGPSRGIDPDTGLGRRHGSEGGHVPGDDSGRDAAVDEAERDVITGGTAATSEIGDPGAQQDAERRPGGAPNAR
jgi:hypothetical protein